MDKSQKENNAVRARLKLFNDKHTCLQTLRMPANSARGEIVFEFIDYRNKKVKTRLRCFCI